MLGYQWVSIGGAIASGARSRISGVVAPRYDFLPDLEKIIGGGLVTLEKTKVIHYRHEGPELD